MGKVFFNRIVSPTFLGQPGDLALAEIAEKKEFPPLLDYVESQIPDSGHLVGDTLTLADLAVASPFVNFAHCGITVDPASHPRTAAFLAAIHARPSFAPLIAQETNFLSR
jgi:glutathione S-transferase